MAQMIAISNQKGGVAKTTSCISLGACLAQMGRRTLIVDLDPQAHLTLAAGLDADELPLTIADLLSGSEEVPGAETWIHSTMLPGMDILPADLRLTQIERSLHTQDNYENRLRETLTSWEDVYDFIVMDCPPSMGVLTINALTAARLALIPVSCEYFASRGLVQMLDVINAVQRHTNPKLHYALVVTMFDTRNRISRQILDHLHNHFGEAVLNTIIHIDTRLRESTMVGEPITIYAPRTRAAQEYQDLADEVIRRINTNQ